MGIPCEGFVLSCVRAKAVSISSCVRFFDLRNAIRLSIGDEDVPGSRRTKVNEFVS